MTQLELNDPAAFAAEFLRQAQLQGFGALGKRDLELLVYVLLERDGAIDRNASNHAAAQQLRVTPATPRAPTPRRRFPPARRCLPPRAAAGHSTAREPWDGN